MKKALQYGLAITTVLLLAAVFRPVTFLNRNKYRAEIRNLYERLEPGMSKTQVQAAVRSGNYPNLEFDSDDGEVWSVSTPHEFGAQNWVLLIEFKGQHVSVLRVRTLDSYEYRPPEAPPDK